ncbi:hypothetical protein VTL71DRAFT_13350 [Oculimacula yallundae]|uniref:Uncharacterized protein n=1 Tax=Oculimacula yallundae TaxID=86028 RepID=A0ABR4CME7_9HELO
MHFPSTITTLAVYFSALVAGQDTHYQCSRQLSALCCTSAGVGCGPITGTFADFTCTAPQSANCCLVSGGVIRLCTPAGVLGVTTTITRTAGIPTVTVS